MAFKLKKKKNSSHVVVLQRKAKKWTKIYNRQAESLVCWLNLLTLLWRSRWRRRRGCFRTLQPKASEVNCACKGHWVENATFDSLKFSSICTQAASFLSRVSFNKESRRRLVKEKNCPVLSNTRKKTYRIKTSEDIDSWFLSEETCQRKAAPAQPA